MERETTESEQRQTVFQKLKASPTWQIFLSVCFQQSDLPLCPSWWTVCPVGAEQNRGKQIALFKSPWEQQMQQEEEAQRLTEKLYQAPSLPPVPWSYQQTKGTLAPLDGFKKALSPDTQRGASPPPFLLPLPLLSPTAPSPSAAPQRPTPA